MGGFSEAQKQEGQPYQWFVGRDWNEYDENTSGAWTRSANELTDSTFEHGVSMTLWDNGFTYEVGGTESEEKSNIVPFFVVG